MRTITAVFFTRNDADAGADRLADAGIDTRGLAMYHSDSPIGRSFASGFDSNGRGASDRNLLGDYLDRRSGQRLAGGAGSKRNALGDFIDSGTGRRVGESAGSRRNALGDFIDSNTGRRVGEGAGSRRNALGDFIDSNTGRRVGEGLGSRRNALGDFIDAGTGRRIGAGAGSARNALGDFIDQGTGRRIGEGAGDPRTALGDFVAPATGQRIGADAGSARTGIGDYVGEGPGHVGGTASRVGHSQGAAGCVLVVRVAEPDLETACALLEAGDAGCDAGAVHTDVSSWRAEGWPPLPAIAMADFSRRGDTRAAHASAVRAASGLDGGASTDDGERIDAGQLGNAARRQTQA